MKRKASEVGDPTELGVVYHGAFQCQSEQCTNGAYWRVDVKYKKLRLSNNGSNCAETVEEVRYLCGAHSRSHTLKKIRKALPKDSLAAVKRQRELDEREKLVEETAAENRREKKRGQLKCTKFKQMQRVAHFDGHRKVFPNFKHQRRKDGFGCAALSPKSLGPVAHGQPGLPEALTIENYHQFGKVFPCEINGKTKLDDEIDKNASQEEQNARLYEYGGPLPVFYERREAAYHDPVPHRHKFSLDEMKKQGAQGNKNIPAYSVHLNKEGKERRYTYVQSRYFYCHQYEKLASETEDYKLLQKWLLDGYNLQIVGYDGYPVEKSLQEHYEDASRPFGHELVLYTMLAVDDPEHYPWNVFKREHSELYG